MYGPRCSVLSPGNGPFVFPALVASWLARFSALGVVVGKSFHFGFAPLLATVGKQLAQFFEERPLQTIIIYCYWQ